MNKTKIISLLSNLLILANVFVGFFQIHWAIIALFIVLHSVARLAYLKAESETQAHNPEKTQTSIAPPMVRNIASVITAVILAVVLYFVGFGVGKLVG